MTLVVDNKCDATNRNEGYRKGHDSSKRELLKDYIHTTSVEVLNAIER